MQKDTDDRDEANVNIHRPERCWRHLLASWKTGILYLTPVVLLPLPLTHQNPAGRCAYVVLLMAVYWITEALPMAVTALLPVLLFPLLGVMSAHDVCLQYFKDITLLLIGGMAVAFAIEKWNLHKRVGLRVILAIGSEPKWLMLSFMVTTGGLSVWMANTAVATMMLPTALAVIQALREHRQLASQTTTLSEDKEHQSIAMKPPAEGEEEINPLDCGKREDKEFEFFAKGLVLSVAYAANIGGTGSLTGTPPNMVMKGILDTLFGDDAAVTFGSWFIYSFPNMVITLAIAWLWLQVQYLGPRFAELAVLGHFIILVLLWVTRQPKIVPGWAELFTPGYVTDGVVAMAVIISLFFWPSSKPTWSTQPGTTQTRLLDWGTINRKMRWLIIFMIGGGFTLAKGCKETGVSAAVGRMLYNTGVLPNWLMVLILCAVIALMTEITSNTATATLFLPILAELAADLQLNPLYLIVPTTVATSFAFMLPVATGPNQIVFATGVVSVPDMVKTGSMMNVLCVLVVFISIHTWGYAIFQLGQFPTWALPAQGATAAQNGTDEFIANITVMNGV